MRSRCDYTIISPMDYIRINTPKYIILHTAAFDGDVNVEIIDEWHRKRGFSSCGYHYVITLHGLLDFGREEHEIGAHCIDMGMNHQSIGICLAGHGNLYGWNEAQMQTLKTLCTFIMSKYNIPAKNIMGHRETGAKKDCPGKLIDMAHIRNEIERYFENTSNMRVDFDNNSKIV